MSDVADNVQLRGIVEQYAAMICTIIRRLDEPWTSGLSEVPLDSASASLEVVADNHSEVPPEEWDSRFEAFREVLSTATKVPASDIHPGTFLATLGIDSITAVQISAKTRRAGFRLTSAQIVQSRSVGDLLRNLKALDASTVAPINAPAIDISYSRWSPIVHPSLVNLVERVTSASAGMEWMIGMWQRSRGSRFQHAFGYRLPSDVDPSKLHAAWDQLVLRHAILRSTFVYDADAVVPYIVVFKPEALSSSWSQEASDSSEDPRAIVQQRMKNLVSHPPPVDRPISRAVFLQLPSANFLVLHLHHFQYDAWSLQVLAHDLACIYAGEAPKSSNDLDSFLQYAAVDADLEREQMQYWKSTFQGEHAPLFPSLLSKPAPQTRSVYTNSSAISGAAALDRRAREEAVSLQNVFLACWAQVQAKHAKSDNPVFSLWHSGRTGDLKDVERLAVPCINVLPFRVSGARANETLALAKRIQAELQARSAVVEQSRLVKVHEWVGRGDEPLSNVFVNIVKIAPDVEKTEHAFLQSLDVSWTFGNFLLYH